MIPGVGPMELIVLLVIALLVFGPRRLPEVGRSMGRGVRELKDGLTLESKRNGARAATDADAEE